MTPNEYQLAARRTFTVAEDFAVTGNNLKVLWMAAGLTGEAGEVMDIVKKGVLHQHGYDPFKIAEELGDIMWYVAGMATALDFRLEDIMESNVEKLLKRYPNGFNTADSIKRVDTQPGHPPIDWSDTGPDDET